MEPAIIVHGGAWRIPDERTAASKEGVKTAACKAYQLLLNGGTALDAVQLAVMSMEDDPIFDAGTGSVLTANGEIEMDAAIMSGFDLNAGSVACVHNIAHPIALARLVMEKTPHTLLVGPGADQFAREMGIDVVPTDHLVSEEAKQELLYFKGQFKVTVHDLFNHGCDKETAGSCTQSSDTVGAVALDRHGNVAYATSTGGITGKRSGRVGDSPIIGAGGYADNNIGAVSSTGHGESISKACLAHRVINLMEQGLEVQQAVERALHYMKERLSGCGGLIAIDKRSSQTGHYFTTERMPWASVSRGLLRYGIEPADTDLTTEAWAQTT